MINVKGHTGLLIKHLAIIITVMVLTVSCQHDTFDMSDSLVTVYPVIDARVETHVQTKALAGYTEYTGTQRQTIYAYALHAGTTIDDIRDADEDKKGYFSPSSFVDELNPGNEVEGWRSTLQVKRGNKYHILGHTAIPGVPGTGVTYTTTAVSTDPTYPVHVTASFSGIDLISNIDPLVCRASDGSDNDNVTPELSVGTFEKITVNGTGEGDNEKLTTKVFLAMDHLYAKFNLLFRLDNTYVYDDIRTIKLKEVLIESASGSGTISGDHTLDLMSGDLRLQDNSEPSYKAISLNILNGPSSNAQTKDSGTDIVTLTDTYKNVGWFTFLPIPVDAYAIHNLTPAFDITVKYDVFDKDGVCTRQDCFATNSITDKLIGAEKSKSYDIQITVMPTYLYQLSDNDAKFEWKIEITD